MNKHIAAGHRVKIANCCINSQFKYLAAFIWKNLDESKSKEELVDKIMDEFEVDEETARTDVEGFVGALYEHGLVLDE